MNNNKLDSKRKLSLDDDDISFKKKTRKETNLLSLGINYFEFKFKR